MGKVESCDWLVFSFCDLIGLSGQRRTNVHLNAVKTGQWMKPSIHRIISVSLNIAKKYIHTLCLTEDGDLGRFTDLSHLGDEALNHTMTTILKIQFITLSNKYIQRCN